MDIDKNNKTLILLTGFACNNNCVMCSLETIKQARINRTTDELIADIQSGRNEGFKRIEFTGGEPGIRKDIFHLIRYAKISGFKEIGISTNGRVFYYPQICKKFIENGINRANISLYGHTSKLHNAITRTPGSFEQTLQGIKNIQKFPFVSLELATVVCRINYKYLKEIGSFIFDSLKIKRWSILDLIPDGNALPVYSSLSVKLTDLSKILLEIFQLIPKGSHINFFDFPLCLFPSLARKSNSVSFIIAKEREEIAEQRGYYPTRIRKVGIRYIDKHKVRAAICKNCTFEARCGGVWEKYLEIYGEDELSILFNKNRCLRKR